jgi:hypothetical protein
VDCSFGISSTGVDKYFTGVHYQVRVIVDDHENISLVVL